MDEVDKYLKNLIADAKAKVAAMSPEVRAAMYLAQQESWVRGEMGLRETARMERAGVTMAENVVTLYGIGWAVKQLWNGLHVCRAGWNGKNMYLELQRPDANSKMTLPYVYMRTAQGDLVPWLCSQTDLLATDWELAYG